MSGWVGGREEEEEEGKTEVQSIFTILYYWRLNL